MNKKGFTLIELLAVLVVLAILALISFPITIRIINQSRENSAKRSIEAYGRAVESYIGNYLLKNDVNYKNIQLSTIKNDIKYNGQNVTCHSLKFKDNGDIFLTGCHTTSSNVAYKYENRHVIVQKNEYDRGEFIKVNGIGFYVLKDSPSDQDYVAALKEEPLTVSEVETYGIGHINLYNSLPSGQAYNANGYGGIAYYSSEICGYVNNDWIETDCKRDYKQSDIRHVVDNWALTKFPNDELKEIDSYKARLITKTEYNEIPTNHTYMCVQSCFYQDIPIYNWLYSSDYWYWTMSPYDGDGYEDDIWYVANSSVGNMSHYTTFGSFHDTKGVVRPVINVYKWAIDDNN